MQRLQDAVQLFEGPDAQVFALLSELLENDEAKDNAVNALLEATKLRELIPDCYRRYRQVVYDGVRFFLLSIENGRLAGILFRQWKLGEESPPEQRLMELARAIPTLHKLGQIIARNQNIDPRLRKWLIHLESGLPTTDPSVLVEMITQELEAAGKSGPILPRDGVLSEASVGAVVPFEYGPGPSRGVFKVLKPGVEDNIYEELEILSRLASHLQQHRLDYGLEDFRFIETLNDVKETLEKEVNLQGEQVHLQQAFARYRDDPAVTTPALLSFSTNRLTAMERINGWKITEAPLEPAERVHCARSLFKAVIARPLFSLEEKSLFHGDPHAGNVHAVKDENGFKIVLLDWSMAGFLSREQRKGMILLVFHLVTENEEALYESVRILAQDDWRKSPHVADNVKAVIGDTVKEIRGGGVHVTGKVFRMLDRMALIGARFPSELSLFRKALFTLEGVLQEVDPGFNPDHCMAEILNELIIEELPQRWLGAAFPVLDRPEQYKTLLSNADLRLLAMRFFIFSMQKSFVMPPMRFGLFLG